ncbi:MAG: hypothetical protein ACRC1Z_16590 [Waterburya sp.]
MYAETLLYHYCFTFPCPSYSDRFECFESILTTTSFFLKSQEFVKVRSLFKRQLIILSSN